MFYLVHFILLVVFGITAVYCAMHSWPDCRWELWQLSAFLIAFYNLGKMSLAIKAAALMAIAFQSAGFTIQWELQSPTGMAATPFDVASPLLNIDFQIISEGIVIAPYKL